MSLHPSGCLFLWVKKNWILWGFFHGHSSWFPLHVVRFLSACHHAPLLVCSISVFTSLSHISRWFERDVGKAEGSTAFCVWFCVVCVVSRVCLGCSCRQTSWLRPRSSTGRKSWCSSSTITSCRKVSGGSSSSMTVSSCSGCCCSCFCSCWWWWWCVVEVVLQLVVVAVIVSVLVGGGGDGV